MKSNQLTTILMALTACSAVASIILCGLMISHSREIRAMQVQMAGINQSRMAATALVNELHEYAKKDPQIKPILQSIVPKQGQAAQPGAQPAAR